LQKVRGKNEARWLAEMQPKWMTKIGDRDESVLNTAIKKMSSGNFLGKTKLVDEEWNAENL
jgi:hypothetical protein